MVVIICRATGFEELLDILPQVSKNDPLLALSLTNSLWNS